MSATFTKTITVTQDDLDELQHVNNVRYLHWVQEISKEHWENTVTEPTLNEIIWVVRNHNITYFQSAVINDTIAITTRVTTWKGAISIREVVMKNNKTEALLVKASTEWCALHPKTLKPTRVSPHIQELFVNENE